jgi:autotransporter-associated beta strand protein
VDYDDAVAGTQWFQRTLWLEKDDVLPHATVLELQRGKVFLRAQTGAGITVSGLSGAAGTFITTDQGALQKLHIDVPSGSHTFDGVIGTDSFPGTPGNGNITLTKLGAGTQILNGDNTFVGATTIAGGSLLINGSLSGSSAVSVLTGGILGGNGAVGPITVAEGGSIAPGISVGSFTTGGVTLNVTRASSPFAASCTGRDAGSDFQPAGRTSRTFPLVSFAKPFSDTVTGRAFPSGNR